MSQPQIKLTKEVARRFYDTYDKEKRKVDFDLFLSRQRRGMHPEKAITMPKRNSKRND